MHKDIVKVMYMKRLLLMMNGFNLSFYSHMNYDQHMHKAHQIW